MVNPMDLTGKVYLITGATAGMGRETCILLSKLGARIIMVARREDKLKETMSFLEGDGHCYYVFDLEELGEIEGLIKTIINENGALDGYVHCAGISETRPMNLTKPEHMEKMMRVNTFAFAEICRNISKKKRFNAGMSIVAISSTASERGNKGKVAYAASKGALDSVVQCMAIELGEEKKIRVNSVNPAWVRTGMYEQFVKEVGVEDLLPQFLGVIEPEEVANLIAFLLSDASAKITGQSIIIDGGKILKG